MSIVRKKSKKRAGFTIIEIVIAMVVFVILVAVAFFGIKQYTAQANATRVQSDLGGMETSVMDVMLNNQQQCAASKSGADGFDIDTLSKYMSSADIAITKATATTGTSALKDPWGTPYQVEVVYGTKTTTVYVYTYGQDGAVGGGDDCVMVSKYSNGEVLHSVKMDVDATTLTAIAP